MKKEDFTELVKVIRDHRKFIGEMSSVGIEFNNKMPDLLYDVTHFLLTLLGFPKDNTAELDDLPEEILFCRDCYVDIIMGGQWFSEEIIKVENVYDKLIEELKKI